MDRSEEKQCGNKNKHKDKYCAIAHIRELISKRKEEKYKLHYYKCEYCGFFHVGHLSLSGQEMLRKNINKRTVKIVRIK